VKRGDGTLRHEGSLRGPKKARGPWEFDLRPNESQSIAVRSGPVRLESTSARWESVPVQVDAGRARIRLVCLEVTNARGCCSAAKLVGIAG